jgi:DNA-binding NtrC family response regulator
MKVPRVLVVEDDIPPDRTLRRFAPRQGLQFEWDTSAPGRRSGEEPPAVILIHSGSESCREAFRGLDRIAAQESDAPLVFLTTHGSEKMAAEALRHGFCDYFSHPLEDNALWSSLQRLAEGVSGKTAAGGLRPKASSEDLVGTGASFSDLRRQLGLAAQCSSNVLITGESGVGKELVARKVHGDSARRKGPFVSVNVAALPDALLESELFGHERGAFTGADARREGKIRQADSGVLFLDEIGDMSLGSQAKILRVVESREVCSLGGRTSVPVDFRLAAATNRDLEEAVRQGTFRLDLYHRLNVIRLDVPPLRQRREDIPALLQHFIARFNAAFGREVIAADPKLLELLMQGDWPGNVRELSNVVEAAFVNQPGARLEIAHLPGRILDDLRAGGGDAGGEKERLVRTLVETGWNKASAARKLRWSRMTLYRKMSRYRISSETAQPKRAKTGAAA